MTPESFERGAPDRYEIAWMSGHVETVSAHQVDYPNVGREMAAMLTGTMTNTGPSWIRLHAEIDGRWCLILQAREEEIRSIRLVTNAEAIPGSEGL